MAALWIYFRNADNYLALDSRQWRRKISQWRRILAVGLPAGGEFAIMFVYMATIYYALGDFGPSAQAGFSIGSRVLGLIQVPAMAIAFAAAPVIGQNFGAKDGERIQQSIRLVLMAVTAVMVLATVVTQWQPELLLRGFTGDQATIADGTLFLKLVSLNLVAQGVDFRVFERVSGAGQYQTAAHQFGRAIDNLCGSDPVAVCATRFPRRTDLVPVHCHDHPAGIAEPVAAAPRASEAAGFPDWSGMRSGLFSCPRTQRGCSERGSILLCMGLFSIFCFEANPIMLQPPPSQCKKARPPSRRPGSLFLALNGWISRACVSGS